MEFVFVVPCLYHAEHLLETKAGSVVDSVLCICLTAHISGSWLVAGDVDLAFPAPLHVCSMGATGATGKVCIIAWVDFNIMDAEQSLSAQPGCEESTGPTRPFWREICM